MMFPEDLKELLNAEGQELMTIDMKSQQEFPTSIESWSVTEVNRQTIEIALVFADPFEVS